MNAVKKVAVTFAIVLISLVGYSLLSSPKVLADSCGEAVTVTPPSGTAKLKIITQKSDGTRVDVNYTLRDACGGYGIYDVNPDGGPTDPPTGYNQLVGGTTGGGEALFSPASGTNGGYGHALGCRKVTNSSGSIINEYALFNVTLDPLGGSGSWIPDRGEPYKVVNGSLTTVTYTWNNTAPTPPPATPPPATPPPAAGNPNPYGWLDGVDCSSIHGWAKDDSVPSQSLNVDLYIDGSPVARYSANIYRGDGGIPPGNHGYSIPLPASYKNGASHSVTVYAIGIDSAGALDGANPALSGTPKSVSCPGSTPPPATPPPATPPPATPPPATPPPPAGGTISLAIAGCSGSPPPPQTISISWTGNGASGYKVQFDDDGNWGNGYWEQTFSSSTTSTAFTGANTSGWNATAGASGPLVIRNSSTYRVRVFFPANGSVTSTASSGTQNCNTATTPPPPGTPPPGPGPSVLTLVPTCVSGSPAVNISWPPPPTGTSYTGYSILIKLSSGVATPQWFINNLPTSPRTNTALTGYTTVGAGGLISGTSYDVKIQWDNSSTGVNSIYLTGSFTADGSTCGGTPPPATPPPATPPPATPPPATPPPATPPPAPTAPMLRLSANCGLSGTTSSVNIDWDAPPVGTAPYTGYSIAVKDSTTASPQWFKNGLPLNPRTSVGVGGYNSIPIGSTLTGGRSYDVTITWTDSASGNSSNYLNGSFPASPCGSSPPPATPPPATPPPATPPPAVVVTPPKPTLTPTCTAGKPTFDVTWDSSGYTVTGFTIDLDSPDSFAGPDGWRYHDFLNTSAGLHTQPGAPAGFLAYGATAPAIPLTDNTTYNVRINYRGANGGSDIKSAVETKTSLVCTPPPPAPPNASATCIGGNPAINVQWDGSQGTSGYFVDATDAGSFGPDPGSGWNNFYPAGTTPNQTMAGFGNSFPTPGSSKTVTRSATYLIRIYYPATGNHSYAPFPVSIAVDACLPPPILTCSLGSPLEAEPGETGIDFAVTFHNQTGLSYLKNSSATITVSRGAYIATSPSYVVAPPDLAPDIPFTVHWNPFTAPTVPEVYDVTLQFSGGNSPAAAVTCPSKLTVANRPYVRIFGGDILAGRTATCPIWQPNGGSSGGILTFSRGRGNGSGTQLAAQALNAINGFSSGQTPNPVADKSLTFANVSGTYGGNFGIGSCPPDYFAYQATPNGPAPTTLTNTLASGTYTSGPLSINGGTIGNNKKVIVYVNGNVYITNNITYESGPWANADAIPSFVLVAKGDIIIDPAVTNLEGVFIAQPNGGSGGTIYTCDKAPTKLLTIERSIQCNNKLTVIGSVTARRVNLQRISGTVKDATSTDCPVALVGMFGCVPTPTGSTAAEQFLYSPEVWIRSNNIIGAPRSASYDVITNLPPIF